MIANDIGRVFYQRDSFAQIQTNAGLETACNPLFDKPKPKGLLLLFSPCGLYLFTENCRSCNQDSAAEMRVLFVRGGILSRLHIEKEYDMLKILDFDTVKSLYSQTDPLELLGWTKEAYKNKDDYQMPPKPRLSQDDGDYFNVMPCLNEQENTAIVKMIGRHSIKRGEERSVMMGDMMIYEADTGILQALMDAEFITTLRTGAAGAMSALQYERKGTKTVGLMGLGNIMAVFADIYFAAHKNDHLKVKLLKHKGQEERLMKRLKKYDNLEFELVDSYEDLVRDTDTIVSAMTAYDGLFAPDEAFKKGVTVVPIMTRGFQNCDLFFDKFYTDDERQISGFKYFDQFKDKLQTTTDVMNHRAEGRVSNEERIMVYNYGIAVLDLLFASKIFAAAKKSGQDVDYRYCTKKYFMD